MPVIADLNTAEAQVDIELGTLRGQIEAFQESFYNQYGHYWQGLPTHSSDPNVLLGAKPDGSKAAGSCYGMSWDGAGINLPDPMRWCCEVMSYKHPNGHGYVIRASFKIGDDTYYKQISYGPLDRSASWTKYVVVDVKK